MKKRNIAPLSNEICKHAKKPKPGNWSLGLVESMKDPKFIVKDTHNAVVIKDKFPKFKVHYLVLPHDNITGIHKLNIDHIKLLEEFKTLFIELKGLHRDTILRAGFHAVPSMQRLHMHVISKDMISECLKTKTHWNSFTTKFFIPYEDILKELKENGHIKKISTEVHKDLMATPLQCNQCSLRPKNMPELKKHLLFHEEKNSN